MKVGDWVTPKQRPYDGPRKARIVRELSDVEGGVLVDPPLDGSVHWNVDALRTTTKPKRKEHVK